MANEGERVFLGRSIRIMGGPVGGSCPGSEMKERNLTFFSEGCIIPEAGGGAEKRRVSEVAFETFRVQARNETHLQKEEREAVL